MFLLLFSGFNMEDRKSFCSALLFDIPYISNHMSVISNFFFEIENTSNYITQPDTSLKTLGSCLLTIDESPLAHSSNRLVLDNRFPVLISFILYSMFYKIEEL